MGESVGIMKAKVITALVLVLFAGLAIWSYTTQENKLQLQKVELKSRETKIKALDMKYKKLDTELDKLKSDKNASEEKVKQLEEQRQQLEQEKQQLQADLQAKLEAKSKLAQASQTVVDTVTQTQTASAASGDIQQIIVDAANRYGVSSAQLLAIARCESTFSPTVVNYSYVAPDGTSPTGLFQYIGSTWRSFSSQAGYGGASIFDATAQANVTAWAFAHGYASHWECKA